MSASHSCKTPKLTITPISRFSPSLSSVAALELLACENDGHRCYIEPPSNRISEERRIARSTKFLLQELSDPSLLAFTAHLSDGTLVGASIWQKEKKMDLEEMMRQETFYDASEEESEGGEEEGEEERDTGWTGLDVQFCLRYWASCEMVRREWFNGREGEREWRYLKQIFVHPSHVHQGIGSALVAHGLERLADREGLAVVLESTEGAVGMYEKLGFEEKYRCETELSEGGWLSRPGMVREAR